MAVQWRKKSHVVLSFSLFLSVKYCVHSVLLELITIAMIKTAQAFCKLMIARATGRDKLLKIF